MTKNPCEWFIRFPRTALVLSGLLLLGMLSRLFSFDVNSEAQTLLQGDERNYSSYQKVRQILTNVEVVVISLQCDDIFTNEGLGAVYRVSEAFLQNERVIDVKSLTHSSKPIRRGLKFEMVPLVPVPPVSGTDLQKLREFALNHPLMKNVMVAEDGKHTLITVTLREKSSAHNKHPLLSETIETILRPFRAEGLRFQVLSLPLAEEEIRSSLRADLKWFIPSVFALLTIVLWATFRSWPLLILALFQQLAFILALPAIAEAAGYSISIFSVILFPLLSGAQLTLLIHVLTSFQNSLGPATNAADATREMLRETFKPTFIATVTTIAGFLSLSFSDLRPIRDFGMLGAIGTTATFVMIYGPGLSLLQVAFARRKIPDTSVAPVAAVRGGISNHDSRWPQMLVTWLTRYKWPVIAATLFIAVGSAFGITRIRTDVRVVEFLSPRSETRQAVEQLDRVYGGINVVQVEISAGSPNGINQTDFLRYMDQVQRYAQSKQDISGAYSYAQLLAMMNEIWNGGKPGSFRLPENSLLINMFVLALKSYDFPFLTALADPDFKTAYLILRTRDMPSAQYLGVINDVVGYAKTNAPAGVTVSAASGIHSILQADQRIIASQIQSAASSIAMIGLVLALLWRSIRLAVAALVTNMIPIALLLGTAGIFDIPLNSITVMVAAICFGIAVDDSIHFITHWQKLIRQGVPRPEAIRETFQAKGRAIISTSVILVAIFAVFLFSSFPPIVHFGLLSALGFAGGLVFILVFLPVLLNRTERK